MRVSRRRFLTIAAAFSASPVLAQPHVWKGRAFGAEIGIRLSGPRDAVDAALHEAQSIIQGMERRFSLYDDGSELVRLNRAGHLRVSDTFLDLVQVADQAHRQTGGLFDPSVQPLWRAVAEGTDPEAARAKMGWQKVRFDGQSVTLAPGQALTFNGIAQGFATDAVAAALARLGFDQALVNIGEFAATGGMWRLGIEDPEHGLLAARHLTRGAIATSSPMATPMGQTGHILHATHTPMWSTVTVEAERAAVADALSTGLVLADLEQIRSIRQMPGLRRITLIDRAGDLITL